MSCCFVPPSAPDEESVPVRPPAVLDGDGVDTGAVVGPDVAFGAGVSLVPDVDSVMMFPDSSWRVIFTDMVYFTSSRTSIVIPVSTWWPNAIELVLGKGAE